jgi:hypothetical protein
MLILQINWSADTGKGRCTGGAHSHQPPRLSTFDKQFLLKCLFFQINWSADAGKGRSACGAHSHQPPSLRIYDKKFILECLFFRSTGAQTQTKGAARVAHTTTSPLVLVPLVNSFYWNDYSSDQLERRNRQRAQRVWHILPPVPSS